MYNLRSRKIIKQTPENRVVKKRNRRANNRVPSSDSRSRLRSSSNQQERKSPNIEHEQTTDRNIPFGLDTPRDRMPVTHQQRLVHPSNALSAGFREFLEARNALQERRDMTTRQLDIIRDLFQASSAPDIYLTPVYNGDYQSRLILMIPDESVIDFIRLTAEQMFEFLRHTPHALPQPDDYLRLVAPWPHHEASLTSFIVNVPPVRIPEEFERRDDEDALHLLSVHVLNYGRVYYETFDEVEENAVDNLLIGLAHNILRHVAEKRLSRRARPARF